MLILLILILAAALTVSLIAIRKIKERRIADSYISTLQRIDAYLRDGYDDQAKDAIITLAQVDVSAATYLQLLKRSYRLAEKGGGFETFHAVAGYAYEAYPARKDINALRVYALMRSGLIEEAWEAVKQIDVNDSRWQPVIAEAAMAAGKFDELEVTEENTPMYLRTLASRNAEHFEEAWRETGSMSFLLDAVLLRLTEGEVYRAADMAEELYREAEGKLTLGKYQKLRFFIAYDTENWDRAESILPRIPEGEDAYALTDEQRLMLAADLAMRRREWSKAFRLYRKIASISSEYSRQARYNRLFLSYEQEDLALDEGSADTAASEAPRAPERVFELAELMLAYDDKRRAEELLTEEIFHASDQTRFGFLKESAKETVNPQRYAALLRVLVNREGGGRYAPHLAWFLMGRENFDSLAKLIFYSADAYGDAAWINFYRGVLAAEEEDLEAAVTAFGRANEEKPYAETYYNMALVALAADRGADAMSFLDSAADLTEENSEKAQILALRAEILYRFGEDNRALAAAERALDLEPSNTAAQLIRSALEDDTAE